MKKGINISFGYAVRRKFVSVHTAMNVGRIFVAPDHFCKGYGIIMMQEVENMFPEVNEITLDTPVWNIRTNFFYSKLGYKEVKRDKEFVFYSKHP